MIKEKNKKIIKGIAFAVFIISFAIALPIFFRPFYYMQIKPSGILKYGTYSEIKQAYDELLNYLIFFEPFKIGKFSYSENGYLHFRDVKILFLINNISFIISYYLLCFIKTKRNEKKFSPQFYASITVIVLFLIIGLAFIINSDKSFIIFHKILFPGKTNWEFSSAEDPVIDILPFSFFLSAILFVIGVVMITTISIIIYETVKVVKEKKKEMIL